MDIISYLLGKKSSSGGGESGYPPNWSQIGYSDTPQSVIDDFNYAKDIYDNWENVSDLSNKFANNTNIIFFPNVNTSNATNMSGMFGSCSLLREVSSLNTSNTTDMNGMFKYCSKLKYVPLFNTSQVTNMANMFNTDTNLITIPQFDTSKVQSMSYMFQNCSNLTTIPLLDTSSVANMMSMFSGCPKLDDNSLDNILKMCIGTTSVYTQTKTLARLGFSSSNYSSSRIQALPSYQDFIDAGWTIGY